MSTAPADSAPPAWILHGQSRAAGFKIWGLSAEERLRRSLARAGCSPVSIVDPDRLPEPPNGLSIVVFRGDFVVDERLVSGICAQRNMLLVTPNFGPIAGQIEADRLGELIGHLNSSVPSLPPTGMRCAAPSDIADAYLANLRKWEPAYVYPARADLIREIEDRTFSASYKGITDLVTKWVWPKPAAAVTRICARAGMHPNTVTIASWVFALAAMGCFAKSWFVTGLVFAWLMTFLDTVDGKLARVTLTSSRLGDILDHGLDLIHPPFWYLAWSLGLGGGHEISTAIVVGGYLAGRLLEGAFLAAFKIETHSWMPIDSMFRTITARRNPNLILFSVGALAGRPDLGLQMVALWTLASLGFHTTRLLQAFARRRRGERVEAWGAARSENLQRVNALRSESPR